MVKEDENRIKTIANRISKTAESELGDEIGSDDRSSPTKQGQKGLPKQILVKILVR